MHGTFAAPVRPTPAELHAAQPIHAALICLNSVHPMHLDRQLDLFRIALSELDTLTDFVNQALEVFEDTDGSVGPLRDTEGYVAPSVAFRTASARTDLLVMLQVHVL